MEDFRKDMIVGRLLEKVVGAAVNRRVSPEDPRYSDEVKKAFKAYMGGLRDRSSIVILWDAAVPKEG